jgi:organic hydroperoxide reductase OsmC/OhrA
VSSATGGMRSTATPAGGHRAGMARTHRYAVTTTWTGDRGTGTSGYRDYDRDHESVADGRPPLPGSSDPAFRGDPARWNPELLLVAALSQCHMLWYLHLCAEAGSARVTAGRSTTSVNRPRWSAPRTCTPGRRSAASSPRR